MLNFSHQTRVFLFLQPVDMRKSFRGLCLLAESVLQEDERVGALVCVYQPSRRPPEVVGMGRARLLDLVQAARIGNLREADR